ncbi:MULTISPECIES: citramalate synthase [Aneurinibacillus]|uniref:Citramalate synthase n=1 Tax=Aneurinibacillus thermoaerophilus TaxID=143495 RepID=A0A1G7WXU3_ANETH|nr:MULTISPECIES: citramalate synthase [Aneurinibacillus]AMA73892.1 transferase [Aneurinibacillus sp. XH2]MED0674075.1 citramalate synthase [Aneurinibacillus thermoaerophilus]MED0678062.1 citramalate synthase [Aneurinibacillus thermoaerophilus]MED0737749.1 citramalate synthase [Aneurinibacillus thermoaerophilus]MED0755736.1 citramalate synthase [Aneurinibacillus thermoaerophilus]
MKTQIFIYDTTLRDGTQGEGVSLSVDDKLKIAKKLDQLGVHYIEGGWPGSNPKDMEFFLRAKELKLKHAKITAFGSTRRFGVTAEADANLNMILKSGVEAVAIFGKSWDFHVTEALGTTLEENLSMIYESVRFLKDKGLEVIYDAEHFFDGYKHNPEYAMVTIRKAMEAGADWLTLCDTNGGSLPHEISEIVARVCEEVGTKIGIHCHNDGELAVANSLAAVAAGATQVQGTINGLGERCGNANLISIIPNLQLKLGYACVSDEQLKQLTNTSRYVYEIANIVPQNTQPFVGQSAFAHKGGMHVSAILKDAETYEHIKPETVGNTRRVLVSELSGQSNLLFKAQELNIDLDKNKPEGRAIIQKVKELEYQGYQYEGAEASFELLVRKGLGDYEEVFTVESFKVLMEKIGEQDVVTEATVKVKVNGQTVHTVAEGNGPVNALDNALRKALEVFFPDLKEMYLTDYKVRVLSEHEATASKVRVLVESTKDGRDSWSTVGVSTNVIEASWEALLDSMRYALLGRHEEAVDIQLEEKERLGILNH